MVSDEEFYKTTTENADDKTRKIIDKLVNKDKNDIFEILPSSQIIQICVWITESTYEFDYKQCY